MGFTLQVMLVYLLLLVMDICAFVYGFKQRKWSAFISITAVMVLGLATLGYLWITSPM